MAKPSIYLETSVPSYYVSRDSRDILILARQQQTRLWWETRLNDYLAFISPVVLEEIRQGDPVEAHKREGAVAPFEILQTTEDVENLASRYMNELHLPGKAFRDAAHIAFACFYQMDFLVTWNCAHIANAAVIRKLSQINGDSGFLTPTICTPDELIDTRFNANDE